ncbi:hypothetical protein [Desulfovibrio litoralis]|uniref:NAD/GMP synthase domain-containing protein n=1 Tax=Desulfovibrio litoralis DSM 11393 TaxID=1121455 RepID=A0A1M7SR26_9BACT|nr:hypothetical protein [Desulfovibrio litoralis]SHN60939.1 uncharacterized protein SAMN02745728_01172 [Desulfovibrio litoralis DSM 11393]
MEKNKLYELLERRLHSFNGLAIAFSGGLDSRFLAYTAKSIGLRPLCIHVKGIHVPQTESKYAETWAKEQGLDFVSLVYNPLLTPEVAVNDKERCYFCKKAMFVLMLKYLESQKSPYTLVDGSNTSDSFEYRPGQKALFELGVLSPLAEVGLTKDWVRSFAQKTGLDNPQQQARPCLLTRFEYNFNITETYLNIIEQAETKLLTFFSDRVDSGEIYKMPDFRLRLTNNGYLLQLSGVHEYLISREFLFEELQKLFLSLDIKQIKIVVSDKISGYFDTK